MKTLAYYKERDIIMKKLNEYWVPRNKKERVVITTVAWLLFYFVARFINVDLSTVVAGVFASFITYYCFTQGEDDLLMQDTEKRAYRKKTKLAQQINDPISSKKLHTKGGILKYYGGGLIPKEKDVRVTVSSKELTYGKFSIPLKDIKSARIETQSQITSRMTMTRMATFGIYALALPKKKKSVDKFLTIDYGNDMINTIVFGGNKIAKIHAEIIKHRQ